MEVRLDGRTALITGGSLGLGKAMAMMFAESGAKVAIVARRQDVLDETKKEIEAATGGTVGANGPVALLAPSAPSIDRPGLRLVHWTVDVPVLFKDME